MQLNQTLFKPQTLLQLIQTLIQEKIYFNNMAFSLFFYLHIKVCIFAHERS